MEGGALEAMMNSVKGRTPDSLAAGVRRTEDEHAATLETYVTGAGLSYLEGSFTAGRNGSVGVIPIVGTIRPRPSFSFFDFFGGATTNLVTLAHDLDVAMNDPSIDTIILNIDSPGGLAAGVGEAAEMIFAAAHEKEIVAYASNYMASAAYWLGSAAGTIVAAPTAIVGSIGVKATVAVWTDDEMSGLKEFNIVNDDSPLKAVDASSEEGRALIKTQVNDSAEVFLDSVAKFRDVTRQTVNSDFGRGDTLIGARALKAGLVDKLGSMAELLAEYNTKPSPQAKGINMSLREKLKAQGVDVEVTAEMITAEYPQVAAALIAQGHEAGAIEGRAAGVTEERARLQAIEEGNPEPEAQELVTSLKYDETQNAGTVALAINAARREGKIKSIAALVADDAPAALEDVSDSAPTAEQLAKDAAIQAAKQINEQQAKAAR